MSFTIEITSIKDILRNPGIYQALTLGAAVGLSIGAAYISFSLDKTEPAAVIGSDKVSESLITATNKEATRVSEDSLVIQRELKALQSAKRGEAPQIEIAKLQAEIDSVSTREGKLEAAILQSPERALELPLLRRDLDDMKAAEAKAEAIYDKRIDQIYDLSKFLFGGIFLLILAPFIPNFFKGGQGTAKNQKPRPRKPRKSGFLQNRR